MQKAWVFGTGKFYKECEKQVKACFDIVGYLDNRAIPGQEMQNSEYHPVYHPDDTEKYLNDKYPIILMSKNYVDMWRQLRGHGVDGGRIRFGAMMWQTDTREGVLFRDGRYLAVEGGDIVYYLSRDDKRVIRKQEDMESLAGLLLRKEYKTRFPFIQAVADMPDEPSGRMFGLDRGNAVDRYYIERFLETNQGLIRGDCLEIAEDTYTKRYGGNRVSRSYVLHINGWGHHAVKGNLATGEGIAEGVCDCAIITQTLMFIYDIQNAAKNIHRMLKKDGTALITVSGISQISRYDADNWGSFYSFHEDGVKALFEPLFGKENVRVESYGNVKTAVAMLYGMCREDLDLEDFKKNDRDYPVIISAVLRKR